MSHRTMLVGLGLAAATFVFSGANRAFGAASYVFEVVNTTSKTVHVTVLWTNSAQTSTSQSGNGVAGSYTPSERICRGWYAVDPKSPNEIFRGSAPRIFVHFSDGITPRKYYRKIRYPVRNGERFEVLRTPADASTAAFRTGGSGDNYQTSRTMSSQRAVDQEGWSWADFYEIDTGRFTINE